MVKKQEAEEVLNNCLWKKKYCPFEKGLCNINCVSFEEGEMQKKGKGYVVKYPRCSFFKTEICEVK